MKPYRPSNGTEGMIFEENFCNQCIHMHPDPDKSPQCDKVLCAMCFDIGEPDYPKEWIQDDNGDNARCTAFVKHDWGNGGDDGNDWKEPEPIIPDDPNQLCMPFMMNDIVPEKQL